MLKERSEALVNVNWKHTVNGSFWGKEACLCVCVFFRVIVEGAVGTNVGRGWSGLDWDGKAVVRRAELLSAGKARRMRD